MQYELSPTLIQTEREQEYKEKILIFLLYLLYWWIDAGASWIGFAMNSRFAPWIELQQMWHKAQFMPQAIHESTAFNSRNRKGAIHCVFSVKDNTLMRYAFLFCFFHRTTTSITKALKIQGIKKHFFGYN